jgi:TolA-binding protein
MKYIDMREALRQVRESTCPKCEGEACECPQSETLEVTNADKMINSTAYQNYKSGDEHYHPAEDLEEQKKQLEEEIEFLSDMKDTMIQEKIQQGFAVRFFDPSNGKRFAAAYPNKAAQLKKDGLKDISITQHTLNFKEENNEII